MSRRDQNRERYHISKVGSPLHQPKNYVLKVDAETGDVMKVGSIPVPGGTRKEIKSKVTRAEILEENADLCSDAEKAANYAKASSCTTLEAIKHVAGTLRAADLALSNCQQAQKLAESPENRNAHQKNGNNPTMADFHFNEAGNTLAAVENDLNATIRALEAKVGHDVRRGQLDSRVYAQLQVLDRGIEDHLARFHVEQPTEKIAMAGAAQIPPSPSS